jgi:hypothetical protein
MYSRPVKSMPVKTKLTAMATPNTGHAARANTFFGWEKTTSLLRALQLSEPGVAMP